jgi:hypothetical protein
VEREEIAGGMGAEIDEIVKNIAWTGKISSIPIIFYPKIELAIATTKAKQPRAKPT